MMDRKLHHVVYISGSRGTRYARLPRALCTVAAAAALAIAPNARVWAQNVPAATTVRTAASPLDVTTRTGAYRIEPGDVLQYRVWPNAELTGDFPVESTGLVYLPVVGAVQVGGKTLDEVRTMLRDMYGKLVQGSTQPVVTVTAQFAFSVMGGVVTPGIFDGRAGMTVFDAISRAGGYRGDQAPSYVDVIHSNGTSTRLDTSVGAATPITGVVLQSQDHIVVPAVHKPFSTQNVYLIAELLLSAITVIKVLGK